MTQATRPTAETHDCPPGRPRARAVPTFIVQCYNISTRAQPSFGPARASPRRSPFALPALSSVHDAAIGPVIASSARASLAFGFRFGCLLCHARLASVAAAAVRADGRPPARLAHVVLSTVRTQPGPAAVLTYHPSATVRADGTPAALLAQRSLPRVCIAEPAAAALPARRALATVGTYRRPAAVFTPATLTTVRTRAAHPARRAILRAVGTRLSRQSSRLVGSSVDETFEEDHVGEQREGRVDLALVRPGVVDARSDPTGQGRPRHLRRGDGSHPSRWKRAGAARLPVFFSATAAGARPFARVSARASPRADRRSPRRRARAIGWMRVPR